jgi:hypothetical protein
VVSDGKIADQLLDKPKGVHVDQLARTTGIDSDKLARVLRFLATKHCFTEGSPIGFQYHPLFIFWYSEAKCFCKQSSKPEASFH